jgi:hypothetical protein
VDRARLMGPALHPPTHILSGWCVASFFDLTPRERLSCMAAAALPDLDGVTYVFGEGVYQQYHHLVCHNLLFAIAFAVALQAFSTHKAKAFALYVALAHLHFVMDYFGSGPFWPIYYLWPFNGKFYFRNPQAWEYTSWQNKAAAGVLLVWTLVIAVRQGRTPVELVAPRLDALFVSWLRSRLRVTP